MTDTGNLGIAMEEVGAGIAPDRETELRIREKLDRKFAFEKQMKEEAKKRERETKKKNSSGRKRG